MHKYSDIRVSNSQQYAVYQDNLAGKNTGQYSKSCDCHQIEINPHEVANARWEKKSKLHIRDQVIKSIAVGVLIAFGAALLVASIAAPFALPPVIAVETTVLAIWFPGIILSASIILNGALAGLYFLSGPKYNDRDEANKISIKLKSEKLENLRTLDIDKIKQYGFIDKTVANQLHKFIKQSLEDNNLVHKVQSSKVYAQVLRENKDSPMLTNYWIAKQRQEANTEWEKFQTEVLATHLPYLTVRA